MKPLKLVGYWSVALDDPEWIHPTTLSPAGRSPVAREALVRHLRRGARVYEELGMAHNRFPGPPLDLGSAELTDGVWLWPEGLSWYVSNHDVPLPVELEEHVWAHRHVEPAAEMELEDPPVDVELWTAWSRRLRGDVPVRSGWLARLRRSLARLQGYSGG